MITSMNKMPVTTAPANGGIKDPKIIKIAKLAIIISDKDTDIDTKVGCIKAALRMGYITEEEATQLMMYRTTLENYFEEDEE